MIHQLPLVGFDFWGKANIILNSAEYFDPATGKWSSTGNLNEASLGDTATLLPAVNVLLAGGSGN